MKSSTAAKENISNFSANVLKREDNIYEFGSFRLDTAAVALTNGGRDVPLKPKAFDLLRLLISEPERVFSKDELMEQLWPDTFVEEANLTQTIYELRRALGESARSPCFIRNIPKRGYRFLGKPRVIAAASRFAVGSPGLASLAVLPFRSLSAEARDESLELGIAETLATGISRLGKLVVRPVSSVMNFAESDYDPLTAGQKLGVEAILHGTIQHAPGNRLRVTARFDRTDGGPPLWAGSFDEHADELFALQDSLLEKILSSLSLKLSGGDSMRGRDRKEADAETHKLFLKCRYHWHKWTPENWRLSIEYGLKALGRDPLHAEACAWTAASYCTLGIFGVTPPAEAFEKAREFVTRSLELDSGSSKAHELLAAIKLFYDWDRVELPRVLRRATELDPNNSTAHNLGALFETARRRFDDALLCIDRAIEIDPLSLVSNTDRGFILLYAGRHQEALEQFKRALELDPYFAHAHYGLGYVQDALGDHRAALEYMISAANFEGIPAEISAEVGYASALAGDAATSSAITDELEKKSRDGYSDPYRSALVHSGRRERDLTLLHLGQALENRSRELIYLNSHPAFTWLRNDVEFARLISAIGMESE